MSKNEIQKEISKLQAAISKHKSTRTKPSTFRNKSLQASSKNKSLVACGESSFIKNGNSLVRVGVSKVQKVVKAPKISKSKNKTLLKDKSGVLYSKIGNSLVKKGLKKQKSSNLVLKKSKKHCQFFRFGKCKGNCRFIHDPDRISPCPKYLLGQDCDVECNLNHSPNTFITPNCTFYEKGNCNRSVCKFLHIKHDIDAKICSNFADTGYCSLGCKCNSLHVFSCPRFEKDGKCNKKGCKLRHLVNSCGENLPIMPDFTVSEFIDSDSSDSLDSQDESFEESRESLLDSEADSILIFDSE